MLTLETEWQTYRKMLNRGKHLPVRDDRKAQVVAFLKSVSGGTKVTLVRHLADTCFQGSCMKAGGRGKPWTDLGVWEIGVSKDWTHLEWHRRVAVCPE